MIEKELKTLEEMRASLANTEHHLVRNENVQEYISTSSALKMIESLIEKYQND